MKPLTVNRALQICGVMWLFIGFLLFRKGLGFAVNLASQTESATTSALFSGLVSLLSSSEWAAGVIMAAGVIVGLLKARHVLSKVVLRNSERLLELGEVSLHQLFDRRFLILMGVMMLLGVSFNQLNLPIDWRAFIDLAVGAALIQGASCYFRYARLVACSDSK